MALSPCRLLVRGGACSPLIKVPSSACTVLEVKLQIEADLGVRVSRQTLWSFKEGEKMENSKKIGDYNIDNFLIRLTVKPPYEDVTHEIKVIFNNVEHKLAVKENETVLDLKKKIEGKLQAKAEEMKLFLKDYVGDEMKNEEPLYRYYIRDGIKITIAKKARESGDEASKNTDTETGSTISKDRDTSYEPSKNSDTESSSTSSKDGETSSDPSKSKNTNTEMSSTSTGPTWY